MGWGELGWGGVEWRVGRGSGEGAGCLVAQLVTDWGPRLESYDSMIAQISEAFQSKPIVLVPLLFSVFCVCVCVCVCFMCYVYVSILFFIFFFLSTALLI